ncbi:nuclear pore complex associated protein [Schizosaccharomyces cryophilus OY26]|uniref:Nuclear pore complex associated protein n=1 Tax=Schizosaccharomyces cryophilus (strain OY26 / ATCC MYA-4695 / CBS 11777 / NBRC 106824 / NRRL Y48691) TaxID=653667 RepID=S9W000_SCHCR|nr:nuclear pore complex associated protein [Schizosaccharomyces cryophilus OY26]EPY51335.1 nuclear pore complex associated protein [Schizosaccharomyces cryophilus OY26]
MHDSSWDTADIHGVSEFLDVSRTTIDSLLHQDLFSSIFSSLIKRYKEYGNLKNNELIAEVNFEQQSRVLEKRLLESEKQLDASKFDNENVRKSLLSSEENSIKNYNLYQNAQKEVDALKKERDETKSDYELLHKENVRLRESLVQNSKDLQEKVTVIDGYKSQLLTYNRKVIEVQHLQQVVQSSKSSYEFELQKLSQKNSILDNNNTWLNQVIEDLNTKLLKLHQSFSLEKSQLNSQLTDANLNKDVLQRKVDSLSKQCTESQLKHETCLNELSELKKQHENTVFSLQKDLESQRQLIDLWTNKYKTLQGHSEHLQNANSELDTLLREAQQSLEDQHSVFEKSLSSSQSNVEFLKKEIASLESQLSLANERLANSEDSGFSFSLKPRETSLSLSDLYTERLYFKQKYEHSKQQVDRLQRNLNETMNEVNLQHPLIKEQFERFNEKQKEIAAMSEQYQKSLADFRKTQSGFKALEVQLKDKSKENKHFEQQIRDLARQVQVLLHEIDLRDSGTVFTNKERQVFRSLVEQSVETPESDTNQLISDCLVSFRNIAELQQQNQKLLSVIRDLAQELEKNESISNASNVQNDTLMNANRIIDELSQQLEFMNEQFNGCIKERDFFRTLVQENESFLKIDDDSLDIHKGMKLKERIGNQRSSIQIDLLTEELESFKSVASEKETKLLEKIRSLETVNFDLQNLNSAVKIDLAKTLEKCGYYDHLLTTNQKEHSELYEKYKLLQEQHSNSLQQFQAISGQLSVYYKQVETYRFDLENLYKEKNLWNSVESKLTFECSQLNSSLLSIQQENNQLKAQLQSHEQDHDGVVKLLNNRLSESSIDLRNANAKISEYADDIKRITLQNSYDIKDYQLQLNTMGDKVSELKQELTSQATRCASLVTENQELKDNLRLTQERCNNLQTSILSSRSSEGSITAETENIMKDLETTKGKLQSLGDEYQKVQQKCLASEKTLEMMNETHDQFKNIMESELREREEKIKRLYAEASQLKEDVNMARQDKDLKYQEQMTQIENLTRERDEMLSYKEENQFIRDEFEKMILSLKKDLEKQIQLTKEAHCNYETEIINHGSTTQKLYDMRGDYEEIKGKYLELKSKSEEWTSTHANSEENWRKQKDNLESEVSSLKEQLEGLESQNRILHSQFDSVSHQVEFLQNNSWQNEAPVSRLDSTGDSELRELVNYLRHEKEITANKHELASLDNKRLSQQVKSLQGTIDSLSFEVARLKGPTNADGFGKPEVFSGSDELRLLYESNEVLRKDNELKRSKIDSMENRVTDVESKFEPLNIEINDLKIELDAKNESIKLLHEDNERWKSRFQSVLTRYERMDPSQYEELKAKYDNLDAEKKDLESAFEKLKEENEKLKGDSEQISALKTEIEQLNAKNVKLASAWNERYESLINSSKARFSQLRQEIATRDKELNSKKDENKSLFKELENVREEAKTNTVEATEMVSKDKLQEIEQRKNSLEQELSIAKENLQSLTKEKETELSSNTSRFQQLEKQLEQKIQENETLSQKLNTLSQELTSIKDAQLQQIPSDHPEAFDFQQKLETLKHDFSKEKDATLEDTRSKLLEEKAKEHESLQKELDESQTTIQRLESDLQSLKSAMENKSEPELEGLVNERLEKALHEKDEAFSNRLNRAVAETEIRNKAKISIYEKKTRDLQSKIAELEGTLSGLNQQLESQQSVESSKKPNVAKGKQSVQTSNQGDQSTKSLSSRLQTTGSKQKPNVARPAVARPVPMKPEGGKLSITGASKRLSTGKNAGQAKRQRDDSNKQDNIK